jgi:hypothetical protein
LRRSGKHWSSNINSVDSFVSVVLDPGR